MHSAGSSPSVPGNASSRTAPDSAVPKSIGKFPVLKALGAGAMGEVFLCQQPELERPVAIKIMRGVHAPTDRFQREARNAARLIHPSIVRVYDVGWLDQGPFLVMEYVPGPTLAELIGTSFLTLGTSLRILWHVADALSSAHELGIVHRDVKPSNILLDLTGRPRVADFGLAKSLISDATLSGTFDLVGTPRYMSPEQVLGANDDLDQRSDLFSLGCVMYEMLSGMSPFDGPTVMSILRRITDEDPEPLSRLAPHVPEDVVAICERALAKEREARFGSAREFCHSVREALLAHGDERESSDVRDQELLGHFQQLVQAVVPAVSHSAVRWTRIMTRIMVAAAILLATLTVGWALGRRVGIPDNGISDWTSSEVNFDRVVERSLEMVDGPLRLSESQTPRDVIKEQLEELSALMRHSPRDLQLRLVRARLLRRGGECLAAATECDQILSLEPDFAAARRERLAANYQAYVLYLGAWNEPHMRFSAATIVENDLHWLRENGQTDDQPIVELVERLAQQNYSGAEELVRSMKSLGPPTSVRREAGSTAEEYWALADRSMLQSDLLFRMAELAPSEFQADPEQDVSDSARPLLFADIARLAARTLRQGLDHDPHHIGLLFLRAGSFQRRVVWELEGEDRDSVLRRSIPQFEVTMDRLRRSSLRQGCDTPMARAVLLSNLGWTGPALEQLQDALSCRPTVPRLIANKILVQLNAPTEGTHQVESLKRLQVELEPLVELLSDDPLVPFLRGMLHAGSGSWEAARRDVRRSLRQSGEGNCWPFADPVHLGWLKAAETGPTEFLDATREIIAQIPLPTELRQRVGMEVLARIDDESLVAEENITAERRRELRAAVHFGLAEVAAQQDDRAGVLEHMRQALQAESPAVTAESFRSHWSFGAWNDDDEFRQLYREFPPSNGPDMEIPVQSPADEASHQGCAG